MKTSRLLAVALTGGVSIFLCLITPPANANTQSRVSAVTAYSDRALITRIAEPQLVPGTNTIELAGLPASLLDQSLQIAGDAAARTRILDVRVAIVYADSAPDTRVNKLQERLASLRGTEQALTRHLEVMKAETAFIDSLRIYYARTAASGNSGGNYQDWQRALQFVERNMDSVNNRSLATSSQLQETRGRIRMLEDEINSTRSYPRKMQKTVFVTLSADKAGPSTLRLSYIVPEAKWAPAYDVRVNSESKNMEVVYSGVVSQATGEDWRAAGVTLSTARPAAGGTPPALTPWEVGILQAQSAGSLRKGQPMSVTAQSIVSKEEDAEIRNSMEFQQAPVSENLTSATFTIPSPADIPSDNTPHRITIAAVTLPVELSYSCVPKLSTGAFLAAKAKNNTDYTFLSGPLNVFLDNSFVTTSALENVFPDEDFTAYMGTDAGVKVERKLVKEFTESTGLLSKKTRKTYDFVITIENGKRVPVDVDIKDQVPVSKDERIAVRVISPEESEAKPDEQGIIDWKLALTAKEKRELRLKFSVEYPSDLPVAGIR